MSADFKVKPKHLWSICEKMVVKGRAFDDIFDLVGIRIIVPSLYERYGALGAFHGLWKPGSRSNVASLVCRRFHASPPVGRGEQ